MDLLPESYAIKPYNRQSYLKTLRLLEERKITTVCIEGNCPNRYECFSRGTATFMILGSVCTRNCSYCNVKKGCPEPLDPAEPDRISRIVKKLGLKYCVVTCVTRDDLEDCGASQFVKTIRKIKAVEPNCRVEVLISDLNGDWSALKDIIKTGPYVVNHNIEVVRTLFPVHRPQGSYPRSLRLLQKTKAFAPGIKTKSGLMVGLGETNSQIVATMKDLRRAGCDILTIGQYLQPSPEHAVVEKYYDIKEFSELKRTALSLGFSHVEVGPLVRSSYMADRHE